MSRMGKGTLLAAVFCAVSGLVIFTVGLRLGGEPGFWIDRTGIHTNQEIREQAAGSQMVLEKTELAEFCEMDIQSSCNDIEVLPSEDGKYYIEYVVNVQNAEPRYEVKGEVLTFEYVRKAGENTGNGISFMIWDTDNPFKQGYVKIYVPENAAMKNIKLSNSDGSIRYEGPDAENYDITSEYGSITLKNVKAESISIHASDGSINCDSLFSGTFTLENHYGKSTMNNIISDVMEISASDGSVSLTQIQTGALSVENTYGGLNGDSVQADSLSVRMSDGSCTIRQADVKQASFTNSYGSIKLELTGREEDYNYNIDTEYGSITVNGRKYDEEEDYRVNHEANRNIAIDASDGSVVITSTE